MEIIQTFMSDEAEVCAISDGTTIHLADKNDLTIENPKVGSVVRSSQMNEVYLEIPISELRELARRSEAFIEPDSEEEDSSEDEEESEEEEEAAPPDWREEAKSRFLEEYIALDGGIQVRVLAPLDVKLHWESGQEASRGVTKELSDILDEHETLRSQVEAFDQRIKDITSQIETFVEEMKSAGWEDLTDAVVHNFLGSEVAASEGDEDEEPAAEVAAE